MAEAGRARLVEQAPVLLTADLQASVAYWRDALGFRSRLWGDPPSFAILKRNACFLMLSQAPEGHPLTPHWRVVDKMWNAYFWVDDAQALFDEVKAAGAQIDYGPCRQPYDVLEFGVQDLDGHDIAFGQDLE